MASWVAAGSIPLLTFGLEFKNEDSTHAQKDIKTFIFIYLFFYFTILYWFCHTSTCIRHGCTCVPQPEPLLPPPSPYHTSGSSQCTSPKLPVSCIEPGLAIHFLQDIINVLMPFCQIIPPSLSHRVQKTVLYICVSFAVLHTGLLHTGLSLPSF